MPLFPETLIKLDSALKMKGPKSGIKMRVRAVGEEETLLCARHCFLYNLLVCKMELNI